MHSLHVKYLVPVILNNLTLFQIYHYLQTALCLGYLTEFNSTKLNNTLCNILFYTTCTNPNYIVLIFFVLTKINY